MTISTREEFLLFFFNEQVLVTKINPPLLRCKIYIFIIWFQLFKNISFKLYRGADKSLARPGRKQVAATECFNTHILFIDCLRAGRSGDRIRWRRDFPHLSRPALRPTQPPVQWVPGLSRG
jgi:hypothetical protein